MTTTTSKTNNAFVSFYRVHSRGAQVFRVPSTIEPEHLQKVLREWGAPVGIVKEPPQPWVGAVSWRPLIEVDDQRKFEAELYWARDELPRILYYRSRFLGFPQHEDPTSAPKDVVLKVFNISARELNARVRRVSNFATWELFADDPMTPLRLLRRQAQRYNASLTNMQFVESLKYPYPYAFLTHNQFAAPPPEPGAAGAASWIPIVPANMRRVMALAIPVAPWKGPARGEKASGVKVPMTLQGVRNAARNTKRRYVTANTLKAMSRSLRSTGYFDW